MDSPPCRSNGPQLLAKRIRGVSVEAFRAPTNHAALEVMSRPSGGLRGLCPFDYPRADCVDCVDLIPDGRIGWITPGGGGDIKQVGPPIRICSLARTCGLGVPGALGQRDVNSSLASPRTTESPSRNSASHARVSGKCALEHFSVQVASVAEALHVQLRPPRTQPPPLLDLCLRRFGIFRCHASRSQEVGCSGGLERR